MARQNNQFQYIGNTGADPEFRNMPNGNPVCQFRLAIDNSYTNRETKERVESVDWMPFHVYNPALIEVVKKYVTKGMRLTVSGSTRRRVYDSPHRKTNDGAVAQDVAYEWRVDEILLPPLQATPGAPAAASGAIPVAETSYTGPADDIPF